MLRGTSAETMVQNAATNTWELRSIIFPGLFLCSFYFSLITKRTYSGNYRDSFQEIQCFAKRSRNFLSSHRYRRYAEALAKYAAKMRGAFEPAFKRSFRNSFIGVGQQV